jgi:dihydropteroate synthase
MFADGATIVDLGAESSRPGGGIYGTGAGAVPWREECDRLLPVLEQLRAATSGVISVDTRKARVAEAALAAGADMINDVSCLADPDMADVLAEHEAPVVLMHSRGEIATMQRGIEFRDVVGEVRAELASAIEAAAARGIAADRLIVDPGIGFGKTAAQNLSLLRGLDELGGLDRPLLVGASRKAFIGEITGQPAPRRVAGSLAAAGWATGGRAQIVRAHDVAETHRFLQVWDAIHAAGGSA